MTLFDLAQRLVGEIQERPGGASHPFIVWCHESTMGANIQDEVPWCSSFVNRLAWLLRLPRSKSAAARSWLDIGASVQIEDAQPGNDVVVFSRGTDPRAGHVAVFAGLDDGGARVRVIGGNQGNNVSLASFPIASVLGVRRLQ